MADIQQEVEDALAKLQGGPTGEALYEFFARLIGNCGNTGLAPLGAMGFNAASLECYYDEAFRMYNSGQYADAIKIFMVMTILCPTEHKFAFGLAASHHLAGDYVQALACYHTSTISDPTDPLPYYHAADCLLKLGLIPAASESLRTALELCKGKEQYRVICDRAEVALQNMQSGGAS